MTSLHMPACGWLTGNEPDLHRTVALAGSLLESRTISEARIHAGGMCFRMVIDQLDRISVHVVEEAKQEF